MIGVVFALLGAFCNSLAVVEVRRRLEKSNYVSIAWVITIIGNIILWPLALTLTDPTAVNLNGVLIFFIAGLLSPGIVRMLYFKGMETVGVSANTSVFGINPMFTSVLAFFLLSEVITFANFVGIVFILIGAIYVERSLSKSGKRSNTISWKNLLSPLLAALIVAWAIIARKYGLSICETPLLGVAIGYSSSFLVYLLLSTRRVIYKSIYLRQDLQLFWKAGVSMSFGWLFTFYALAQENASVVSPLTQTSSFFVFLLVYLYLKELEHISLKLVISNALIVAGAMLIGYS